MRRARQAQRQMEQRSHTPRTRAGMDCRCPPWEPVVAVVFDESTSPSAPSLLTPSPPSNAPTGMPLSWAAAQTRGGEGGGEGPGEGSTHLDAPGCGHAVPVHSGSNTLALPRPGDGPGSPLTRPEPAGSRHHIDQEQRDLLLGHGIRIWEERRGWAAVQLALQTGSAEARA